MSENQRNYAIDRIRVVLTALVIFHHTAITYGGSGSWFYRVLPTSGSTSSVLLTIFCSINQAFFMGFFFFISGYYTPHSLAKKGYREFLTDRFLRLGLPLLFFGVVLGPITLELSHLGANATFQVVTSKAFENWQFIDGPLWFAKALLIFTLAYCGYEKLRGARPSTPLELSVPSDKSWMVSAFAVGLAALIIRQLVPVGENIFGLQIGYFASYIFLFAVGIAAGRHQWLTHLKKEQAYRWAKVSLLALPIIPLAIVAALKYQVRMGTFVGGLSFSTFLYAFWEPWIAWGIIAGSLFWSLKELKGPSKLWSYLARRAYLVYIIHPWVLVTISIAFAQWEGPALLRFILTGALACFVCWVLAGPLIKIPGVGRIV